MILPVQAQSRLHTQPEKLRLQTNEFVENRRVDVCQVAEFGAGHREGGGNQGASAGHCALEHTFDKPWRRNDNVAPGGRSTSHCCAGIVIIRK